MAPKAHPRSAPLVKRPSWPRYQELLGHRSHRVRAQRLRWQSAMNRGGAVRMDGRHIRRIYSKLLCECQSHSARLQVTDRRDASAIAVIGPHRSRIDGNVTSGESTPGPHAYGEC
jgi:hypothetical protein